MKGSLMKSVRPRRDKTASTPSPKRDFADLFIDAQFCFDIYAAANNFNRVYGNALVQFGLTLPQLLVLMTLWEHSPRRVGDIASALGLDTGTVTPMLKRLEGGGLVKRARDEGDQRVVNVYVTAKALALREPIIEMKRNMACELDLSVDEVEQYRECLQQITRKFGRSLQ